MNIPDRRRKLLKDIARAQRKLEALKEECKHECVEVTIAATPASAVKCTDCDKVLRDERGMDFGRFGGDLDEYSKGARQ